MLYYVMTRLIIIGNSVSQHLAYRGRILNPGSADQFSGFGSLIFLNSGLIELGGNLLLPPMIISLLTLSPIE